VGALSAKPGRYAWPSRRFLMTPRFDIALKMTLQFEGRGQADAQDPGGRTDYGISERAHPDVWADGQVTSDEVYTTYWRDYWLPIRGDQISDARLALEVFDFAVNAGVHRASVYLQAAYNALRPKGSKMLATDGKVGPLTIAAVNAIAARNADGLYNRYVQQRRDFYQGARGAVRYLKGWLKRCGCGAVWAAKIPKGTP